MFQVDSLSNKGLRKIFCLLLSQLCTAFVFILCWYNIIIVSCKCWAFTADSCWEMMLSWIMLANTVLWCDQLSAPIINSQLLPLWEAKAPTDERNSVVGADVLYQFLCPLQTDKHWLTWECSSGSPWNHAWVWPSGWGEWEAGGGGGGGKVHPSSAAVTAVTTSDFSAQGVAVVINGGVLGEGRAAACDAKALLQWCQPWAAAFV